MTKFSAAENDNLIRLAELNEAAALVAMTPHLTGDQTRVLRENIDAEFKSRFDAARWFADKLLREEQVEADRGETDE